MEAGSMGAMTGAGLPSWELAFRFEGGRLPLAFTATVGERWRRGFERLTSCQRWADWLTEAGLADAAVQVGDADVEAAKVLRESIYRAFLAGLKGDDVADEDVATINAFAATSPTIRALTGTRGNCLVAAGDQAARCLSDLARQTIDMLSDDDVMARVRECAAPDCALLFYDASRPGRRRWCSDRGCGTRNRARRRRAPATSA